MSVTLALHKEAKIKKLQNAKFYRTAPGTLPLVSRQTTHKFDNNPSTLFQEVLIEMVRYTDKF